MEKYNIKYNNEKIKIKRYGKHYENVSFKHERKYQRSSQIIQANVDKTYNLIQEMIIDNQTNLLLVGKVQSGKTSNLELLTALLFDNGYNLVILYGGYDNSLLNQSVDRFRDTFDAGPRKDILLFTTFGDEVKNFSNNDLLNNQLVSGKKVIIVSLKSNKAIEEVNNALSSVDPRNLKAFIIDDEGDQASLNTEYKKNKESVTYQSIVKMKKILNNPLYISTTATPYASILQPYFSLLNPEKICTVEPGIGYYGANNFHVNNDNIIEVDDHKNDKPFPDSLQKAINHYLLSSAILFLQANNESNMVIHVSREIEEHKNIYTVVNSYLLNLKYIIQDKSDITMLRNELGKIFNTNYFSASTILRYNLDDLIEVVRENIINHVYTILYNSEGKQTQSNMEYQNYKIFIGGDLLQRGLTFNNLLTTYFTRWTKNPGSIDTTIQRARWFGYRGDIIENMRIFTSREIKESFSVLTEIENDLWAQIFEIESGNFKIEDLLIDVSGTEMRPARSNVIYTEEFSFNKKWYNQSLGFFEDNVLLENNTIVNTFINSHNFVPISNGRTDNNISGMVTTIKKDEFEKLLSGLKNIFTSEPLNLIDLYDVNEFEQIDVISMTFTYGNIVKEPRTRSFSHENKVSALQQGADTVNEESRKYLGDSFVIRDNSRLTIQISEIIPMRNKHKLLKYKQYMFSVYIPKVGRFYRGVGL